MDITLLVSKVLGIYMVVSGLFILIKQKTLPHLLKDFFDHPAVMYLTGVILLFLSSLYLLEHNIWDGSWKTLITVLVWITLLKGLTYIFAPQILSEMTIRKSKSLFSFYGLVAIAAGIYLFLLG